MHFSNTALTGATLLSLGQLTLAGAQGPGSSVTAPGPTATITVTQTVSGCSASPTTTTLSATYFTLYTTDEDDTAAPDGTTAYLGVSSADFANYTDSMTFNSASDTAALWSLDTTSGLLTLESGPTNTTGGIGYYQPRVSDDSIGYAVVAVPSEAPAYVSQYPLSCFIDKITLQFTCQFFEGGNVEFWSCDNILNIASPNTTSFTDLVSCRSGGTSQLTLYASYTIV